MGLILTMTSISPQRAKPKNRSGAAAAVLLCTAALLAVRSLSYTGWYQNWRYSRMPLAQLATTAQQQPGNPIVLYYYGKALNAKGRCTEALVPLEHAAGLDPDDARVRGEWSTAQLAGGYITGAFGQLTQFVRTHPDSAPGHLLLGRFYVGQNSYVRATEELEQAVHLDSHLGEAWSLLAGARQQMGSYAPARDAARQAVALRPESAADHILLASLLLQTNDGRGARAEYAKAVTLAPGKPEYLGAYARVLLNDGDTKDLALAEATARHALALNPHALDSYYTLGQTLIQEGKPAEAIEPLRVAASTLPPGTVRSTLAENAPEQFLDPMPARELARAYQKAGNTREATLWEQTYLLRQKRAEEERRLTDTLRNHPEQAKPHRQMALFLARRGDVEGVAKNLGSALKSAPDAPRVLIEAANLLSAAGYGALGVPLARRATVFSHSNPAAYEAWGNALLAMGYTHEAAAKYAQTAGWWPEKMPLYQRKLAETYRQRRLHPSEAEKLYAQALTLEHAGLGTALNAERVQALLERAVALDPKNTDCLRYLLRVFMRRHELVEAEQTARALLALSPEDGLGNAMLALLLVQNANSEQGLAEVASYLQKAEQVASVESAVMPTVHYGQGILALRRHQPQEAVRLLRLAATEDPSAEAIYYQLAQAERMSGNVAGATKAQAELARREERKRQELDLLRRIAVQPDDRQRYTEAIRFYDQHGLKAQAAAVAAAMRQRFGADRS